MDLKDFDALLHDAEVKMKRLKALYEQWFQGIERIEPLVARKDLERLFSILSKDKPRNTAARFRFQQTVARYSLYTTYWGRVARQIEEGTYERDVRRARKIRAGAGADAAKVKEYELDLEQAIEIDDPGAGEDDIASMLSALDARVAEAPVAQPKPALSAFSAFAMRTKKGLGAPPLASPAHAPAASTSSGADAKPLVATPTPLQQQPSAAPSPIVQGAPALAAPPAAASENGPSTSKKPVTATFGKPRTTGEPTPRSAVSPVPSAPRPLIDASHAATPGRPIPPIPPRPPSASSPLVGPSGPPRPPLAPRPATAAPPIPPRPPTPAPTAALVPRSPVGTPARPGASAADGGLKHLYDNYVAARRRNNESVENVAYDKLAASVQQMKSKLREKHGDRHIDFEVVVQNGKVGIKPKIG